MKDLILEKYKLIDDKPYTAKETCKLIGSTYSMLFRLIDCEKLKPDWYNNTRPIFLGKTIREYRRIHGK